jgi:hypothetical protein
VCIDDRRYFDLHASGMISIGGRGMMRHAALEPRHSRNALQR